MIVDGRRVPGSIKTKRDVVTIALAELPKTGMHLLQVQNPGGLFSNDFIFFVEAAKTETTANPVGTWRLAVKSKSRPDRDHMYSIQITREGDKLVGVHTRSKSKPVKATSVTRSGSELSFTVPRSSSVIMVYKGTIAGDSISGTMEYRPQDGSPSRRKFSGRREKR